MAYTSVVCTMRELRPLTAPVKENTVNSLVSKLLMVRIYRFSQQIKMYRAHLYFCNFFFSVAWFTFDPVLSGPGLQYSENNTRVTGEGWEHRIALGSLGFSRGLHYWEFTIEKYDTDTDPSFGIARIDVTRDKMLGKNL